MKALCSENEKVQLHYQRFSSLKTYYSHSPILDKLQLDEFREILFGFDLNPFLESEISISIRIPTGDGNWNLELD